MEKRAKARSVTGSRRRVDTASAAARPAARRKTCILSARRGPVVSLAKSSTEAGPPMASTMRS
eukprot:11112701-Lingulodinium_polyedra.AAC.1